MRKKQKIKIADFSDEKKESIHCYFSLLTQEKKYAWVDGTGYSMLPLFWPGCKVRVNTDFTKIDIGEVVLFTQGRKVVAHRVVKKHEDGTLLTKGDTLYGFDRPIRAEEIVGFIDCVKKFRTNSMVVSDPALAAFSLSLGDKFADNASVLPLFLKKIYYFARFIPGFLYIKLQRKGNVDSI